MSGADQGGVCASCGGQMTVERADCYSRRYATFFAVPRGGRSRKRTGTVLLVCLACNRTLRKQQA